MSAIETTVMKGSRPCVVYRRSAGVRGNDGRYTEGATTTAVVKLYVQPGGTSLVRNLFGDSSDGMVPIWAAKTNLAAAYQQGDADKEPLGWAGLQIAPPENTNGPPGDRVEWQGRVYEVMRESIWDDAGLIPKARIRVYAAADRGAA